jgi:hypothetical protein
VVLEKKVLCHRCMNKEIVQGRSNLKPPDTFSGTIEEMIFLQFSKKKVKSFYFATFNSTFR